tara:strand:- start:2191 stop:2748 length:558 start_codon:yes stop_codon:yes gene_type:complete
MVSTNDIRAGQAIIVDGNLMLVLDQEHIKPGKGKAFVRTKLKNLDNNVITDKTFRADEDVEAAFIENEIHSFLFSSSEAYTFMNLTDYTQQEIQIDQIGDTSLYLTEGLEVNIKIHNDKPISIELPATVILEVVDAEPSVKGDTVSSATKVVTCSTGLSLDVPLFIEKGEFIKVDTKSGTYITRA